MRSELTRVAASRALILAMGITAAGATDAEGQRRGPGAARPSIQSAVVPGSVQRDDGSLTFRLTVEIPADHHGYIDRGDDGFFIPLSFSFPDLMEAGVESQITSAPEGSRDEKVRAQVLRGSNEFGFSLTPATAVEEVTARIRYQICNDITDVCYPPGTQDLVFDPSG